MSNEIKCKTCGFENPHSSKFCNHCGAKLPLSTHIICPNCETPNTRDRIFCDTCGTRLVPGTSQLKPEEPEETPPPTASEPFSLPARRPGDTGELHPHAVPDWLRTGDIGSTKDNDAEESDDEMSEKKGTSDLPDWLVHDSDPEPIINAPTSISTEFYQDLLDKAEDLPQPDDLFPDDDATSLPDWLSEADDTQTGAAPHADEQASAGLTGWLSDLSDEGMTVDDTAVSEEPEDDLSSGLTDWLHELDDLGGTPEDHTAENAAALDELLGDQPDEGDDSDWLQELGPAQTDVLPLQTAEPDEETSEELPGWMDELGPVQTNLLDPSQIAELTGPLTDLPEDEIVDDEEAGADVSFTNLFETATGSTTDDLPDWLDTAVEDVDSFLEDLPDEPAEEMASDFVSEGTSDWLRDGLTADDSDLDWLLETGDLEVTPDAPEITSDDETAVDAFAFEDDSVTAEVEDTIDSSDLSEDDDLSWLSDMEAIETGELVVEPAPKSDEWAIPDEASLAEEELLEEPEEAEAIVPDEAQDDTWTSDTFFAETAVGADLPDWLSQLDKTDKTEETVDAGSPDEEMPEWIASMRPGQGIIGSELPGVFPEMDLRDTLEGIPEELAGAELPEWLQDTPLDQAPPPLFAESDKEESMEIPDWLQPDSEETEHAVSTPAAPVEQPGAGSSRDEWRSLLEELPPLTPLAESLPKADIPEWVQQLKPPELTGEPPREPEGPEEVSGPLKGMQGIVSIEPAIAKPRAATLPMPYVTTPEQQQQVALLQQLTQEMPETVTTLATKPAYDTAVWLRVVLAILLIAAVLVGLRGPSLVATDNPVPANVQAVETAVSAAAGQPVLLAVEYTPAMAGELSPQAELLLAQLAANGSPVFMTSQYAAGTAVANNLTAAADVHKIGYLPGESIGLRQLGDCLGGRNECEQLNGRLLDADLQAGLSQIGLVIVLTGDRDNLVNWIEQVGSVSENVPMVAGVTQALTPLAKGYAVTGQLDGLLGGMPDAAAYQQLMDLPEGGVQTQLNAQIFGQLLAGLLLLIGLVMYGTRGLVGNRQQKK